MSHKCPLFVVAEAMESAAGGGGTFDLDECDCIRELCAWWYKDWVDGKEVGRCAIVQIARNG